MHEAAFWKLLIFICGLLKKLQLLEFNTLNEDIFHIIDQITV